MIQLMHQAVNSILYKVSVCSLDTVKCQLLLRLLNLHVFKHFLKGCGAFILYTKCCIMGTQRMHRNTYRLHLKKKIM